ncbi:hypothetical protein, partial [Gorillibacterium massiliense]|uniref:hypothetical protein n=1 Tax=Gorillibacterium massiliense TaxID=1280390 RepID=UPI0005942B98
MLRCWRDDDAGERLLSGYRDPDIWYNYLGQFDNVRAFAEQWKVTGPAAENNDPQSKAPYKLLITSSIHQGKLHLNI